MQKSRLEAFSDGVIAIIITIMVLELKVPHGDTIDALVPLFPVALSYVLSFVYLGIYWNNHHHIPGSGNTGPVAQQAVDGKKLFLKNCRQCHGATGEPNAENKAKYPKIKSLNDAKFLASLPDDSVLTVMKKGAGKDMKGFADKLSDEEMRAVLQYVHTLPKG